MWISFKRISFFGHDHDELVALHAIIHDAVPFFPFDIEIMFMVHLSSYQTVPNPGRVASVIVILVPALHWTRTNPQRLSWMYFTSYFFMIIFTVD